MDIELLLNKAQTEELTAEEQTKIMEAIGSGLNGLRESDPVKFLELVNTINENLKKINAVLRRV
jgi:predicted site-specific integrase-resolvase